MKLLNMVAWGYLGLALFFGALFALAAGFTLATTQLLFEHGFTTIGQVQYSWEILWQLYNATHGMYSGSRLTAIILSWILLACYTMANSVKKWIKGGIAHEGLEVLCHAMIMLDGIANWIGMSGEPWYYQALFTFAIYIGLAYLGRVAFACFSLAVMEFF